MTSLGTVIGVALVVTGSWAHADTDEESGDADIVMVPHECMPLVPENRESPVYWEQSLSLAACLQDTALTEINEQEQLEVLVRDQMGAVSSSMLLYTEALQRAPKPVQFRAAYHIGLASVALLTRARRSISGDNEPKLREELDRRLEPVKQMARVTLGAVVDSANLDPSLVTDPVGRNMARSAAVMLRSLGQPRPDEQFAVAR